MRAQTRYPDLRGCHGWPEKSRRWQEVTLYSVGSLASASGRRISAEYELPFMAHAPMEPGNCSAHFQGSKIEMWAPTQVPQDCRDTVAQTLGLNPDQVKVNVYTHGWRVRAKTGA